MKGLLVKKEEVKSKLFKNLQELTIIKSDINNHLMWLYMFSVLKNAKVIVELGVRSGSSTQAFLAACSAIPDSKLYSYDITLIRVPKWSKKFALLRRIPEAVTDYDFWEFTIGDALEVHKEWEDASIDILFIDDNHKPDHIYKELNFWSNKVKKDGYILMHDVYQEGSDLIDGVKKFYKENTHYEYTSCWCNSGLGILFQPNK